MKNYARLLCLFIAALLLGAAAIHAAEASTGKTLLQAAVKLYNFDAFNEALPLTDQAIDHLKSEVQSEQSLRESLATAYVMKGCILFKLQRPKNEVKAFFGQALLGCPEYSPPENIMSSSQEIKKIFLEASKEHALFLETTFVDAIKLYANKQFCASYAMLHSIKDSYTDQATLRTILDDAKAQCGSMDSDTQAPGQDASDTMLISNAKKGITIVPLIYTSPRLGEFGKILDRKVKTKDVANLVKKHTATLNGSITQEILDNICRTSGIEPKEFIVFWGQIRIDADNPLKNKGKVNLEINVAELPSKHTEAMKYLFKKSGTDKLLFIYYKDSTTDAPSYTNPDYENIDVYANLYSVSKPNKPIATASRLQIRNSRYLKSKTENLLDDLFEEWKN